MLIRTNEPAAPGGVVPAGAGAAEARPAVRSADVQDVGARGHALHHRPQHELRASRAAARQRALALLDHPGHRPPHTDH